MSNKSKFYDIVPKEGKSIRNIPIPEKGMGETKAEEIKEEVKPKNKNSIKKHDHKESSSVEIKKLKRPITNVEEYNEDEYVEIIDHKISDDETVEEVHMLGENKAQIENTKIPELTETEDENFSNYTKKGMTKRRGGLLQGSYRLPLLILIVLVIGFFVLGLFSTATITIKTENLKVSLGSGVSGYSFDQGDGEVLQATTSSSVTVPATGTVRLDKKAVGTVVIFNNTSAGQKLTKGTRLQASNGLIYLLDSAVTVPAKKTVAKKVVLGSVTTTVTAETVGDKYNSGPKDFVLPGFKGTAKYDTIYGRSKGSITGGYSGEVPNISQKDLGNQVSDAKEKMKADLLVLLKKQADSRDLVINSDTLQYKITNSEAKMSNDQKQAVITINGTLQADTLLNASISETAKGILGINDGNGFKYNINLASSTVDISNPTNSDKNLDKNSESATQAVATGDVQINVFINKEELAKSLENKGKKEALSILQQTKGVIYAQIKSFPFWKTSLPKANGITILVQD